MPLPSSSSARSSTYFFFSVSTCTPCVLRAVGGIDRLIDWEAKSPEIDLMRYMDDKRAKEDKAFDQPKLMKTPVVRNGKQATVGYCPEIWETWE